MTSKCRILVVDDDRDTCEVVLSALAECGFETRCAYDAPSALAALEGGLPDVLLIDVRLGSQNGEHVVDRMRAMPGGAQVQVIFMTGDYRQRLMNAALLRKPFELRELEAAVSQACEDAA